MKYNLIARKQRYTIANHSQGLRLKCNNGSWLRLSSNFYCIYQKFTFIAKSADPEDVLVSITNLEPKFIIQDLSQEAYTFEIVATNEKGSSKVVEIYSENIIDMSTGAYLEINNILNKI